MSSRKLAANVVSGLGSNITRMLIQLIMLPLMARLLGPAELGLYALALPMVNFVLLLSDAGLGDSLAKEHSDDRLTWSSAFWGLMISGICSAIAVYAISFLLAHWSNQPRLPSIILPLCLTLPMVAATVVPSARMLRRGNMVFGAVGDMIGNIAGAGIAIALAFSGFGVWAMVVQFVTIYAVRMLVYNIVEPFRPSACFSLKSLASHTGMGGQILGGRLMDLGTSMIERSQISRHIGAAAVGGYANAIQIGLFASNALGSPLWANLYYVAITRPREEVLAAYVRAHRTFAVLTFPTTMLMAVAAPTIVPIFFGEAWRSNVPAIIVMLLACPWGNLAVFYSAILFARNDGRYVLYLQVGNALFRILGVLLLWRYGVFALVITLAVSNVGYYLIVVMLLSRFVGNQRRDLIRAVAGPSVACAAMGMAIEFALPAQAGIVPLILLCAAGVAMYGVLLLLIDRAGALADLQAVASILRRRTATA